MILVILGFIVAYAGVGAIALAFYAKYFREAVGNLSLTTVKFEFTASTMDWFKLIVGNILLIIFGGVPLTLMRGWIGGGR